MKIKIDEIFSHLKAQGYIFEYAGRSDLSIEWFSSLSEPKPATITWIKRMAKYDIELLDDTIGLLIVADEKYSGSKKYNIISAHDPKSVYFSILRRFFGEEKKQACIGKTSVILSRNIGSDVWIGEHCFIDKDVVIGNGAVIKHNVVIEGSVTIGEDCFIDSGAMIGTAGFGYYTSPDGRPMKVPDFGGVSIGNRVVIGANNCIARGTIKDTVIGDDTKFDNMCHIGHNVFIGKRVLMTAQVMLAGSVTIEDDVYLAPSSVIINQASLGENSFVGIGAVVTGDVEANKVVAGVPAKVLRDRDQG